MNLYTLRDSKANAYLPPFTAPNHAVAIRMVTNTALNETQEIGKNPEDFTLFFIGKFNEDNGKVQAKSHENLGKAVDMIVFNGEKDEA